MTPLHQFGELVRNLFLRVPLPVVRGLFVAVPLLLLIWVLCLPREDTSPDQPTGRWGENLKIGAGLALVIQIVIYLLV